MITKPKLSILFVCHGNICRSPMAEFIMKNIVSKRGFSAIMDISSAATSNEEIGNPVYQLAKRTLAIHGIGCRNKVAVKMTKEMCDNSTFVIAMDNANVCSVVSLTGDTYEGKLYKLLDFTLSPVDRLAGPDIADPWYTRDFNRAWDDLYKGCSALLDYMVRSEII